MTPEEYAPVLLAALPSELLLSVSCAWTLLALLDAAAEEDAAAALDAAALGVGVALEAAAD